MSLTQQINAMSVEEKMEMMLKIVDNNYEEKYGFDAADVENLADIIDRCANRYGFDAEEAKQQFASTKKIEETKDTQIKGDKCECSYCTRKCSCPSCNGYSSWGGCGGCRNN